MPTTEKIATVDQLTAMFTDSKALVLADFTGVDVASVSELRNQLREASVEYQVVKNRLAKRAVEAAGMAGLEGYLKGPTAIAVAREDPLAPAQILQKFVDNGYTSNDFTFESFSNWEIESIKDNNILVYEHNGKEKVFKYEKTN